MTHPGTKLVLGHHLDVGVDGLVDLVKIGVDSAVDGQRFHSQKVVVDRPPEPVAEYLSGFVRALEDSVVLLCEFFRQPLALIGMDAQDCFVCALSDFVEGCTLYASKVIVQIVFAHALSSVFIKKKRKTQMTQQEFSVRGVLVTTKGEMSPLNLYSDAVVTMNTGVREMAHLPFMGKKSISIVQYPTKNRKVNEIISDLFGFLVNKVNGDFLLFRDKSEPVVTVKEIKTALSLAKTYPLLFRYLSYFCITREDRAKHDLLLVIMIEKKRALNECAPKKHIQMYERVEKVLSKGFVVLEMRHFGEHEFQGEPMGLPLCWFVINMTPTLCKVVGPRETALDAAVAVSQHAEKLVSERKWIRWDWIT